MAAIRTLGEPPLPTAATGTPRDPPRHHGGHTNSRGPATLLRQPHEDQRTHHAPTWPHEHQGISHLAGATKIIPMSNKAVQCILYRGSLFNRVAIQEMFCTRQHVLACTYVSSKSSCTIQMTCLLLVFPYHCSESDHHSSCNAKTYFHSLQMLLPNCIWRALASLRTWWPMTVLSPEVS